jgi:hypothetical protein
MIKLYIGYINGVAKVDTKTNAFANQGWSATVSGFKSIPEACSWANRKLKEDDRKKPIQHYWYWISEYNQLIYIQSQLPLSRLNSSVNVDERNIVIRENNRVQEKRSLFPKLVNWSPQEGLVAVETFAKKMLSKWKWFGGKDL